MATQTLSQLVALATEILEQAKALEAYHISQNLPPRTFDESASEDPKYPPEQEATRSGIANACEELNALVLSPFKRMQSKFAANIIYFDLISRFSIATKVPINGTTTYTALSESTGVSEAALRRILRFAIANHIFTEPSPGHIGHSAVSRLLADSSVHSDWLSSAVNSMMPAQVAQGEAIERFPAVDEASQTGYMIANNATESSFYLHMAKDPAKVRTFQNAMKAFAGGDGHALRHLVDSYPWGELGAGTVVDLGGSTGAAAFAIAEKFPALKLVVQDLPKTVAQAQEKDGVQVKFMAHSFFDPQPVVGADLYLSRWCFHNWSDKHCIQILEALIPALKDGARILIMDAVMPRSGEAASASEERRLRGFDVAMMAMSGSQERELEDWKYLFASVDKRFRWNGVTQPKGSELALIEAVWATEE